VNKDYHKEMITGMTNWNWIKFGVGFCCFFSTGFTQKAWILHGCPNSV